MLRKALVYLRRQYNSNFVSFARVAVVAFVALTAAAFAVDILLPLQGAWNFLRTLIMIPLGAVIYAIGYFVGLYLHYDRMSKGDWIPYRMRYSLAWRQRISLIVGAFLFVFIYATGRGVGYTFTSAVYLAVIIAIFAFLRATKEEALRDELEIPDNRDIRYEADFKLRQEKRKQEELLEEEKKEQKLHRKFLKNL